MSSIFGNFIGQALSAIATFQYYSTSAIVLFYYEYFITFDREVRFAWKNRFSLMSVMFLSLRYMEFLAYIPTLFFEASAPSSNNACIAFAHFPGAMNTVSLGIITIFLVLRTYAIHYRHVWVLVVTVPLGIVNVALAAWSLTKVRTILFTFGAGALRTCVPAVLESDAPFRASWGTTIAFDTLISVLTISKTYRMHRENREIGMESRLAAMLLQDGSLYYSVMTAANVLNFILFCVTNFDYLETSAGNSSEITHSISVIIVSRMMLNIMEAADADEHGNSDDSMESRPNFSTIHFTTQYSIGPVGRPTQSPLETVPEGVIRTSTIVGKGKRKAITETWEDNTSDTQQTFNSFEGRPRSRDLDGPSTQC